VVRERRINDGSLEVVVAYYCECEFCRKSPFPYWDIKREKIELIENVHKRIAELRKEYEKKLLPLLEEEARITGICFYIRCEDTLKKYNPETGEYEVYKG